MYFRISYTFKCVVYIELKMVVKKCAPLKQMCCNNKYYIITSITLYQVIYNDSKEV